MTYPSWNAGMKITSERLAAMMPTIVVTTSDYTRNASTTFLDTSLIIPSVAGAVYEYELFGAYSTNATADFKTVWSVTTSTSGNRWVFAPGTSNTLSASNTENSVSRFIPVGSAISLGGVSLQNPAFYERGVITAGDAGNQVFQIAQDTSNASNSTLLTGSRLLYRRIQ